MLSKCLTKLLIIEYGAASNISIFVKPFSSFLCKEKKFSVPYEMSNGKVVKHKDWPLLSTRKATCINLGLFINI